MEAETLVALQGSIRKWEAIVANGGGPTGAQCCPLCAMFNWVCNPGMPKGCNGCPVKEKTGKSGCTGTPYDDYEESEYSEDSELMHKIAVAEVDFLKSLLPPSSEAGNDVNG